ncbi:MAG: polysaccharide deacetylase family protein, partial [Gemmatimonadales bacterium]
SWWQPSGLVSQPRRVAITFDDVPLTGSPHARCDADVLERLTNRLVGQIEALGIPATGLVVESRMCKALRPTVLPRLLRVWIEAGLDLGNHTFSHPDLNDTPPEAYKADIVKGEATVRSVLEASGMELRYFRYPMLHAGASVRTKVAIETFLVERGYTIAPVTIDNQEWVFAAVYSRARQRRDSATARRISEAYLSHMDEAFHFYERLSLDLLGYELPQVLLLHANELNADLLGELAGLLEGRGYRFISLDEALEDPAYRRPDEYVGRRGLSWLQRWAVAEDLDIPPEPREPAWVAELFRTY